MYIMIKIQFSENFLLILTNTLNRSVLIMLLFPLVSRFIYIYERDAIRKTTPFAFWMFLGALIMWFI